MTAPQIIGLALALFSAFVCGRVTSHRNADEEMSDIWESVHEADQKRIEFLEQQLRNRK